jgi:hypothetical protein
LKKKQRLQMIAILEPELFAVILVVQSMIVFVLLILLVATGLVGLVVPLLLLPQKLQLQPQLLFLRRLRQKLQHLLQPVFQLQFRQRFPVTVLVLQTVNAIPKMDIFVIPAVAGEPQMRGNAGKVYAVQTKIATVLLGAEEIVNGEQEIVVRRDLFVQVMSV